MLKGDNIEERANMAKNIIEEINKGLSFFEASKKYSALFESEDNGNLGWRKKSQIPSLFVDHLNKMEKKDILTYLIIKK